MVNSDIQRDSFRKGTEPGLISYGRRNSVYAAVHKETNSKRNYGAERQKGLFASLGNGELNSVSGTIESSFPPFLPRVQIYTFNSSWKKNRRSDCPDSISSFLRGCFKAIKLARHGVENFFPFSKSRDSFEGRFSPFVVSQWSRPPLKTWRNLMKKEKTIKKTKERKNYVSKSIPRLKTREVFLDG